MSKTVKLTRTIVNLYIIGKTTHSGNITTIEKPYEVIMGMEGIQMIPMDKHLLGKDLEYVTINNNDTLYSEEPGDDLRNLYLETISGIEIPKQELIL
jgi:arginine utilization protein RocB